MKRALQYFAGALLFGAGLFLTVFFVISNGEAFAHVKNELPKSSLIEGRHLGKILSVSLYPFGPINVETVGAKEQAKLTVTVKGTEGSAIVEVQTSKANGLWTITSVGNAE